MAVSLDEFLSTERPKKPSRAPTRGLPNLDEFLGGGAAPEPEPELPEPPPAIGTLSIPTGRRPETPELLGGPEETAPLVESIKSYPARAVASTAAIPSDLDVTRSAMQAEMLEKRIGLYETKRDSFPEGSEARKLYEKRLKSAKELLANAKRSEEVAALTSSSSRAHIRDVTPPNESTLGQLGGILAESAPPVIAGIGTFVATRNPALAAAVGGGAGAVQQTAATGAEALERGASGSEAMGAGMRAGAYEFVGEYAGGKIVFNTINKAVADAALTTAKRWLTTLGVVATAEGASELVTQLAQDIDAKYTFNPDLTWEEIRRNAALATGAGALGGVLFGGAATGAATLADRSRREAQDAKLEKLMAAEMQRRLDRAKPAERIALESLMPTPPVRPTGEVSGAPYTDEPIPSPLTQPAIEPQVTVDGQPVTPGAAPLQPVVPPVAGATQTMAAPVEAAPMPAPPVAITRTAGDQLAEAIRQGPGEGLKFVADNAKTLMAMGIRPATTAAQLYKRGAVTKEQAKAFISGLSDLKVQDQVEAELRLDSLDKQLKVIDDYMREQAQVSHPMRSRDIEELKAIDESLAAIGRFAKEMTDRSALAMTDQERKAISRETGLKIKELLRSRAKDVGVFDFITSRLEGTQTPFYTSPLITQVLTQYKGDVQERLRTGQPAAPGARRRPSTWGFEGGGTRFTESDIVSYSNRGVRIGSRGADLQPGEVGVSDMIQPHLARQIVTLLDRWIQKVYPEASVFVIRERRPNFGGHQTFYRDGRKTIVIAVNPEEFGHTTRGGKVVTTLNPRGVSILSHELGHGISRLMFHDAPAHVKDALIKAWNRHVMDRLDKTLGLYLDETRGSIAQFSVPGGGQTLRDLFMRRFFEYQQVGGENKLGQPNISVPGDFTYAYWTNMDEWFAHQMERVLESDYQEMTAPIKTFFKRMFVKMKQILELARHDTRMPDPTFKMWLDAHRLRADARATEATVEYLKTLATQLAPASQEVSEIDQLLKEDVQIAGQPVTDLTPKLPPWASKVIFTGLPAPVLNNLNFDDAQVVNSIGGLWRGTGINATDAGGFERDLDKFSKFKKWTYTLINVARINPHIKELWNPAGFSDPATGQTMFGYIDYVIKWANERMQWMSQADQTLRLWRKLPGKQRDTLARFMLDQTVEGQYKDLRDPAVQAQYPMSPETLALFQRIDGDYKTYIEAVEETLVVEAQARLANNPMLTAEIRAIRERFAQLKDKPYFPLSRFGKYTITVRAARDTTQGGRDYKAGDTIYFGTYDWAIQRDLDFKRVARMYPGQDVQKSKASETVRSFAGMPAPLIEALKTRLNLTPEQREELNNYLYEIAPGQAFVKHLIRRKNTPGFSDDAERAYANYFLHGSNHLARLKYRDLLSDAHKRLVGTARATGTEDATKRMEIANYIADHLEYIMNPENDWAAVRGAIAVAYLGGMLKTAWVNMTQVPMVTYPELARQYGDAKAITAITRAYGDLMKMYRATKTLTAAEEQIIQKWINGIPLTPAEERFIQGWSGLDQRDRASLIRAQQEGFIDQSFAMELAGIAGGGWLSRFHATNQAGHYTREFTHALMVPFEMGERINRRVTFIAALRLARATGVDENSAYLNARQAVYDTQYEYSRWNRPELLQGKKGIVFMFMQYVLNTLFFASGGANRWYSAWRWWAMMLMAGGLMGLPFAENLKDLAVWAYSKFQPNKRLNVEYELKKMLRPLAETLGWSPDLFLHGASRYGFGLVPFADLSGSMSMGRIIPATDVLAAMGGGMKWNDAVSKGITEAGGATSALIMRMLKAAASDDPDTIRRVEQGMPFSLGQSMMTAMRWYSQGGEETWNGERIVGFDPNDPWQMAEILGKGIFGLQPTALAEGRLDMYGEKKGGYDARRIRQDFAHFYAIRRQHLLEQLDFFKRDQDTENVSKTLEEIRNFNQTAPASARLQGDEIRRSLQQREKARKGGERGTGTSKLERGIAREIREGDL